MGLFSNQTAWIIGASGGIGNAIASSFAQGGANIAMGYYSGKESAFTMPHHLRKLDGVRALPVYADVRALDSLQRAYEDIVHELPPPDILVYAAGDTKMVLFQDFTEKDLENTIALHIKGLVYAVKLCLPGLLQKKAGRIVVISSLFGEVGGSMETLYSMAKGGQNALVKSLGKELSPSGITVNAVAPGAIDTPMLSRTLTPTDKEQVISEMPMGRLGTPDEVAALVCYLCSQNAQYMTGQVIRLSGGWDG